MSDSIHDDPPDDQPVRPKGLDTNPGDVLFIVVAALSIVAMVVLLVAASFER